MVCVGVVSVSWCVWVWLVCHGVCGCGECVMVCVGVVSVSWCVCHGVCVCGGVVSVSWCVWVW